MEEKGIRVYSNTFGYDITADLPAITAAIRAPLEDPDCQTVVDAGGDDLGARILIQFDKYFTEEALISSVLSMPTGRKRVRNGALDHIEELKGKQAEDHRLFNNTHLWETTVETL